MSDFAQYDVLEQSDALTAANITAPSLLPLFDFLFVKEGKKYKPHPKGFVPVVRGSSSRV